MSTAIALRRVGLLLIALGFLMPGHFLPWASFQSQWVAALGGSLVVLGAAVAACVDGLKVSSPPLATLAFSVAAVPWLQLAAGQLSFFSDALVPSAYLIAFGLAVIGGSNWSAIDRADWLEGLFAALALAGGVSAAIALSQWLSLDIGLLWVAAKPQDSRPFANLGQPNHLALLVCLGAIGILRAHLRGHLGPLATSIVLAWFGLAALMTQSRTGWLIVALFFVWWAAMRRRASVTLPVPAVVLGVAVFFIGVASWDTLNEALRLQDSSLAERMQGGTRPRLWAAMVEAITRVPWFGYGFNQSNLAQQAVAVDMPAVNEMAESAHNVVLDLMVWVGVPLALVIIGAWGAWLVIRIRECRSTEDWFVLAAVGATLTHAMLEYPLEHLYFLLPLGLLVGSLDPQRIAAPRRKLAWPLAVPALTMVALLTWVGAEYLRVERASHNVRMALLGIGDPASPEAAPPDVLLLDAPREYHRLMLTPAREGMSADELDWMRRVTQRHAFPPAMLRYALAVGLNGRADEAALTLRRLCSMHAPARCVEARESWLGAQRRWPVLAQVPAP